ncbi:MAG: PLP-dependent transferase [Chloracidobacterium sp.]|nr:PLP-dependent transferase [Chloracidobacterium sp.]
MGFSTVAIHAGNEPDIATGAVSVPIYQTSTYKQEALGKPTGGYEYARTQNPTRSALERNISALENAKFGFAFASGMSAIDTTLKLVKAGDHVILGDNTYGGTFRLFNRILKDYGIEFDLADTSDLSNLEKHSSRTRNGLCRNADKPDHDHHRPEGVSGLAHANGAKVVCDNTFMSPYFQRPIDLGVDIVVHSTTKYLNGHSDSVGGFVALNDEKDAEWIGFVQNAIGAILSPMDSFLVLLEQKRLPSAWEAHDKNGRMVANFLAEHPKVEKVYYPGLASHPQHELAKRQQTGFGGMVSFETGSLDNARKVLEGVKLCTLGESLGGVESLISHPASMTHASIPEATRAKLGITDGLVRISVGIEDVEDILEDLDQALT